MNATTKQSKKSHRNMLTITVFIALALLIINSPETNAQPTGLEISSNITETAGETQPSNRTDLGGTITTITMDILQQNPRWKAYVGNLTGVLALDDNSGQSIFRWELGAEDVTGNIFMSKNNAIDWSIIQCSTVTLIEDEDTTLGFNPSAADTINRTFNETTHSAINIGTTLINQNTCRSTSTYVNNAQQTQSTASFQIILLSSSTNLVYATPINKGAASYKTGTQVDFQGIVPNEPGNPTTYYFYAEIGT
jgi:hypothetical protein